MSTTRSPLRAHLLLPALLALLAVLVALGGEEARLAWRWERAALADGAWWRLFSGQFAHLGLSHLALNLAGLVLVFAVVGEGLAGRDGWLATLASALAVGLGLYWWQPDLAWYVGLSGLLHGLLVAGVLGSRSFRPVETAVWLVLIAAKLAWESWAGELPGTAALAGGPVITAAHLYGALGGALVGVLLRFATGQGRGRPV